MQQIHRNTQVAKNTGRYRINQIFAIYGPICKSKCLIYTDQPTVFLHHAGNCCQADQNCHCQEQIGNTVPMVSMDAASLSMVVKLLIELRSCTYHFVISIPSISDCASASFSSDFILASASFCSFSLISSAPSSSSFCPSISSCFPSSSLLFASAICWRAIVSCFFTSASPLSSSPLL